MKEQLNKLAAIIKNHKKAILLVFGILFLVFIYFFIFYKLPSPLSLKDFKATPLSTHILDRNGKLLYQVYQKQKRTASMACCLTITSLLVKDIGIFMNGLMILKDTR